MDARTGTHSADSPVTALLPRADFVSGAPARQMNADALLAEMAAGGRKAAVEKVGQGSSPSVRPPKIRYTHEAMARLILENPWISQNQLAAHFSYSPAWISTVITSDAFQSYYAQMREELLDPELRLTLEERFRALTTKSLQVLQEKLSRPANEVSDQLALRAAELGAKSLGIGGNAPPAPAPDAGEHLARLADRLMSLRGVTPQPVTDATVINSQSAQA